MNAAFSEIQDGAFSHLPLLQFLYGWALWKGGWEDDRTREMLSLCERGWK